MRTITIDFLERELFALPDGIKVSWTDLLKRGAEFAALMQSVSFGRPDYVMRTGKDFVATASAPAKLVRWGITLQSAAKVTFTVNRVGDELRISRIKGVRLQLPLPLVPEMTLDWVNVRVEKSTGNFLLTTRKFLIPVTVTVTPDGTLSLF